MLNRPVLFLCAFGLAGCQIEPIEEPIPTVSNSEVVVNGTSYPTRFQPEKVEEIPLIGRRTTRAHYEVEVDGRWVNCGTTRESCESAVRRELRSGGDESGGGYGGYGGGY